MEVQGPKTKQRMMKSRQLSKTKQNSNPKSRIGIQNQGLNFGDLWAQHTSAQLGKHSQAQVSVGNPS